ncbi:MAG: hypothetical protein V1778_02615 [bacterium]
MIDFFQKFLPPWLIKNRCTLYAKYIFDTLLGRNVFLRYGNSIGRIPHASLAAGEKKTILFPTEFFLDRGLAWQTTIAKALEVRGHEVVFMPLDISFPRRNALYFEEQDRGFIMNFYRLYTKTLLRGFSFRRRPYSEFGDSRGFEAHRIAVSQLSEQECRAFTDNGYPIGVMALNSVIHHFRCGPGAMRPDVLEAYKDYLAMGLVLRDVLNTAFDVIKPDIVFVLNGSFLNGALELFIARKRGIRVVTFEAGFMLNSLMLGENEPIVSFPMQKYLPREYASYQLVDAQNQELDSYLKTRSLGKDCIFDYWGKPVFDHEKIREELGIPNSVTPDILFTNLQWDSAMIDCDIAFESQLDWIATTIEFYARHHDRTLLIRIHPAEINPPFLESQDKIEDSIRARFPNLPHNVILIPPTSTISSYPLTEISGLSLVYASTAGLEAAIMGKTTLVAGKTHYRGMDFTHDIQTKDEYLQLLESAQPPLAREEMVAQARKYAYFFFFGFMIPFPLVTESVATEKGGNVHYRFTSEQDLLPGHDAGLDFVLNVVFDLSSYHERLRALLQDKSTKNAIA